MNDDLTERARALLDVATPGPWEHRPPPTDGTIHKVVKVDAYQWPSTLLRMEDTGYSAASSWDQRKADAEFIAAAPTLVADLLAEVERLRGQWRDLYEQVDSWWGEGQLVAMLSRSGDAIQITPLAEGIIQ